MNDKDITIEINYLEQKLLIKNTNKTKLEDLIRQSAKKFNIEKDKVKNIIFIYIDEVGDINKIYEMEHILNISKEVSPEKYKSIIYLKISPYESYNLSIEEDDDESIIKKMKEYENKLNKMKEEKDQKIKELEEIINKMNNNKHSEELNRKKPVKTSKDNNNSVKDVKETLKENKNKKEKNKIDISKIELLLNKNNIFSSTIQEMKNEIFAEIKEGLKNEKNSKYNEMLESLKTNISNLNSNIKDNMNKLNIIKNDISLAKDAINQIEKKRKEKKDNNKNKDNDNDIKKNIINNTKDMFNANNMPLKNVNKTYRCSNCNNCYIFEECSNEGQVYNGHYLVLDEFPKNNGNDNNNDNYHDINDDIVKEKEKENEIINNNNNNINDNKENLKNENIDDIENLLNKIFFNDDKKTLKNENIKKEELNKIEKYYASKKNIDINVIENYHDNYFEKIIKPKINPSQKRENYLIKNKMKEIKSIIENIKKNLNK